MARIASLDLGSNSFHLLVAETRPRNRIRRLRTRKHMVRLGEPVNRTGALGKDAYSRGLKAVEDLFSLAKEMDATELCVVGTDALRRAEDGDAFLDELRERLGIHVQLLPGESEAALSLLGMSSALNIPNDEQVIGLDLGGGSFEVALGTATQTDVGVSLPLGGAVTMDWLSDPPLLSEEVILFNHCVQLFTDARIAIDPHRKHPTKPIRVIGTAGSIRSLGRLAITLATGVEVEQVRGVVVTRSQINLAHHRLCSIDVHDRMEIEAISAQRADLLPGCGVSLLACMDVFGVDSLTLCDWGLREGVLLDLVNGCTHIDPTQVVSL
ncbi:hypothetical protein [Stomatohabitans albus]|uniref:Ppx/GppA phosphatase family protein n=1 Tax=Stomatohabitans albus TaxID=3110766 RepID=UPI00300CBBD1